MNDYDVDDIANGALDAIDAAWPVNRAAVIVFHPADPADAHALYSNASAALLVPALRAMLARLEGGGLRLPVDEGFRWVDDAVEPHR